MCNEETISGTFPMGRQVFVKPTEHSFSKQWKVGTVTKKQQRLSVEVDGLPHHVPDVRLVPGVATEEERTCGLSVSEDAHCTEKLSDQASKSANVNEIRSAESRVQQRRGVGKPRYFADYQIDNDND